MQARSIQFKSQNPSKRLPIGIIALVTLTVMTRGWGSVSFAAEDQSYSAFTSWFEQHRTWFP